VMRFRKSRDMGADFFVKVYKKNLFQGKESISGPGSSLHNTVHLRTELQAFLKQMEISVVVDAPCGDFHWFSLVNLGDANYIGVDVVPELIRRNTDKHTDRAHSFVCMDLTNEIPPHGELLICRDLLVHLSYRLGLIILKNLLLSEPKYLALTNFPGANNIDVPEDEGLLQWRPIDLEEAPYNLPSPIARINERYEGESGVFSNKEVAIWKLEDIASNLLIVTDVR